MKTGKYLLYMNYENIKMFICNTWIMKTGKYLLYWIMKTLKYLLQYMNYENRKISALHELRKH